MGWLSQILGFQASKPGVGRRSIGRGWQNVGKDFLAVRYGREPDYDLVGESQWQDNLAKVVGERHEDGVYWHIVGQVCFEDNNPADRNAVVVLIEGHPGDGSRARTAGKCAIRSWRKIQPLSQSSARQ